MKKQILVAALCVDKRSIYKQLPKVECFDIDRDVRTFAGGMPVVVHPPCRSWSKFCAHQAKPLPGEKDLGPRCVYWLRQCGGVLEHPAHSRLFEYCGLPLPGESKDGLWTIEVLQSWWGHVGTQKKTWLCFAHIPKKSVHFPFKLRSRGGDKKLWQNMPRSLRSSTCLEMAEWLVATARLSKRPAAPSHYLRLMQFAESFLSPERNGYAVDRYVRDQARVALGLPPVEHLKEIYEKNNRQSAIT
jgi:hypothetical protein